MPINVPRTQTEDFTSRFDGNRFSNTGEFTPNMELSSPMTGEVVFDYDVDRNSYLVVRITDMDGGDAGFFLNGWTRQSNPRRYRYSTTSSNSPTTLDIPEGHQLTHMHLGSRLSVSTTINHLSVTGFSEGLIDRVWYNEWIAEVYQGRDLIYTGPEPVEVSEVVGNVPYSPAVEVWGGPFTYQHRGEVGFGVEHETDPFDGTGESIELHFVVEDNDGVVDNLMGPGDYPNRNYTKTTVPAHFGHDDELAASMRGVVSHRGRFSRLAWFGDWGLDYYGVSSFIHLRPGERLVYWVIKMNVRSWPDDGVMPRVPIQSLSPPT